MKKTLILATLALGVLAGAAHAQASDFPARSVRAVLPYSVGSGPDAVTRMIGEQLAAAWRQPFIVENKPGANGWLAIGEVKRSAPDGYSVAVVDNTHMTLQPHLYSKMPFDPSRDFIAVAPIYTTHFFIVVAADSPWRDVGDLVEAARRDPGRQTYGTWGMGSVAHVGATMFQRDTGTSMTHVPFKELPQLYTAVANGEVDWAFGTAATVQNLYQAGRVKLLALAAPRRLALYPDVPTVAQAGGPAGFELKTWVAAFAPKGTPPEVVKRLNADITAALAAPSVRQRFETFGFDAWAADAAAVARAQEEDSARFAGIVKQASISLE
ncbi:Bug family tripartite tricarboxylate transporter substrate binding protein [Bordetella genomosp. 2]|uniref:TctC n=1 Tax=Bordetella genomosp. 2 TaxID=1983456 RepID=A0A261VFP5_9BORD|nr:tripartite tricarboxylate transporter substrate binding protein [Bordetella genomosp. 2]OZI72637.1 TctC [Bordetella genomosp. 2]